MSSLIGLRICDIRYLPGSIAGLLGPSAVIELSWSGPAPRVDNLDSFGTLLEPMFLAAGLDGFSFKLSDYLLSPEPFDFCAACASLSVFVQILAYQPVGPACVLERGAQRMKIAVPWHHKKVLAPAVNWALVWLLRWKGSPLKKSEKEQNDAFEQWLNTVRPTGVSPNTLCFVRAAIRRGIPYQSFDHNNIQFGWGSAQERLEGAFTGRTSYLATRIARNKYRTKSILLNALIPTPPGVLVSGMDEALDAVSKLNWPIVAKPMALDQGQGVTPGLENVDDLRQAIEAIQKLGQHQILLEKHVPGHDYRLLVVGGHLIAAAERVPGGVYGDGVHTVAELLKQVNSDLRRGESKRNLLISINLNHEALKLLEAQSLAADAIPEKGRFVQLRRTANICTGGFAQDVLADVHPDNRVIAERTALCVGLDIAGVDFLCPDISRSWKDVGGWVCEVNAQPGFRPHWLSNPQRDLNGEILDGLIGKKTMRIPTVVIAGTNGKTTVARMLHHIWRTAGKKAGVCTTQGIWIGDDQISNVNLSGQPGGKILLSDPTIEVAIIEMPRKAQALFGHPCDAYDVGALLNVQDDHIGDMGIESLDMMARFKAHNLECCRNAVVVNADDCRSMAMLRFAGTDRHVLVSMSPQQSFLCDHVAAGGEGVSITMHEGQYWIAIFKGSQVTRVLALHELSCTLGGLLKFNEHNALFAVALAFSQGISVDIIRTALQRFSNSPQQNPGRYNLIEGFPFKVLLDFAHNLPGLAELCSVVDGINVTGRKIVVCYKVGNRHRRILESSLPLLANHFDTFILSCEEKNVFNCPDYKGEDPVSSMLSVFQKGLENCGVDPQRIAVEPDKKACVEMGLSMASQGDLLVLIHDPWTALPILKSHQADF